MRRGDIVLYSGRGLLSCAIRRVTQSLWSHSAWVWDEMHLLESDWEFWGKRGVQIEHADVYPTKRTMILRANVPDEKIEEALRIARSKLTQRYDFALFFSIGWMLVAGSGELRDARYGWICAELIAQPLWEAAEFRFRDDVPVDQIVPEDMAQSVILGRSTLVKPPGVRLKSAEAS